MKLNNLIPELYCSDMDRSLDFYTRILGFKILYQRLEEKFAMLDYEGAHLMIEGPVGRKWITAELQQPYGRGINFQITSSNVESLYKAVQAAKWPIWLEMEEKWYRADNMLRGSKQFLIQDPDGYLLRFSQSLGMKLVSGNPA